MFYQRQSFWTGLVSNVISNFRIRNFQEDNLEISLGSPKEKLAGTKPKKPKTEPNTEQAKQTSKRPTKASLN